MRKVLLLLFFFCTGHFFLVAQFTDNFTDGNFTANPVWLGGTADFTVNPSFQLQSNNTVANSAYYLSTASSLATTAHWEFYHQITFNPSSANYTDVFLTASASDLTLTATTGYFVRIGNTADEIALYRKDGAAAVKIIDGVDGILNTSNSIMKIKVVRNASNLWTLSRDMTGTGNSYFSEGVVTDATYSTSSFFGILIRQSTASFFQRHFFDDIEVKPFVPDVTPPAIVSATALTQNTLDVLFNEPVDLTTSQTLANYSVSNGIGFPSGAVRDVTNLSLVHLTFGTAFPARTNLTLTVNGVQDLSANAINNGTANFSFFIPVQFDVVIDELMADPTPQVSLPNSEWMELRNTSLFTINLQGWKVIDATGQSGPMPSYILKPDSFVIVCAASSVAALSVFGPTISVTSFPSLDNAGDVISLLSAQNRVIHSVSYTDAWYQNELKKDGGWTLEMIDTKNPCTGIGNWRASTEIRGGSPALKNSVDGNNKDVTAPKLMRAFAIDNLNISLVFDEPIDSLKGGAAASYSISDGIGTPLFAVAVAPVFDKVNLRLATPILPNKVYSVTVNAVTDCSGNIIGTKNTARFGLSVLADSFDVVINEILFNPPSTGTDYVEIYNRSNKIIDLKQLSIANRNSAGVISSIRPLSAENYLLFPEDFIVITEDPLLVKANYIAQNPDAFVTVLSMPSFSDDKGNVIILNAQGNIVDELKYDDKWHFALVSNTEGVSLERIDYNAATQLQNNWHSAATSAGYGTPTYKNSQYKLNDIVKGEITVTPGIVSPDNDGLDDIATISYSFGEPGYVANITIFDAAGRVVKTLQRNALCGIKGNFRWDGLGERNQQLPVGIYIVYTEIFNLQGKKKQFKNVITLARRY